MRVRATAGAVLAGAALAIAGGCASSKPAARDQRTATATASDAPVSQEQAAALFDAALHDDKPRLKLMVDWPRYRLVSAWQHAHADHAASTAELSQIEAESAPSEAWIERANDELQATLAATAQGPKPPERMAGVSNALFGELLAGPPQTKYPSLPRLWELTSEAVSSASQATYSGARKLTLLFMGDRLVGVLEAR